MNNIERLLAIEGIKATKARYFRYLDTKDLAGSGSCVWSARCRLRT